MSSFETVFMAFSTDYLMWVMMFNAVSATIIGVFFLLDPVACSLHNKWFHKTLAAAFFVTAYTRLDRLWNRGLELFHGDVLNKTALIDGEIAVAVVLVVILFMTAYDYAKNKTSLSVRTRRKLEEFHSPCDGCTYKPHIP